MNRKFAVGFLLLLLLGACGLESETVVPDAVTPEPETEVPEEAGQPAIVEEEETDPFAYFLKDGSTAYFKGEGNEYAELSKRTVHLAGGHIAVYEDNGGTTILTVYRLGEKTADVVKEEPEFYEEYQPSLEELQALESISRYIELPIKVGALVDGMPVKEIGIQVQTPYQTFDSAILTESQTEEGVTIRSYFVEGFGEVKREFIMADGENEYIVTSSLESID